MGPKGISKKTKTSQLSLEASIHEEKKSSPHNFHKADSKNCKKTKKPSIPFRQKNKPSNALLNLDSSSSPII